MKRPSELTELEVYNKFEEEVMKAENLTELEAVGNWLAGVFLVKPEYKETLRPDLGAIYKRRLKQLQPRTTKRGTVYLRQWFARKIGTPRELEVQVTAETDKAYKVKGRAIATPTDTCRHCGRKLTHPVSVLYGIGPECGKHYHIPQEEQDVERIREMITSIKYEGWIPKSGIVSKSF